MLRRYYVPAVFIVAASLGFAGWGVCLYIAQWKLETSTAYLERAGQFGDMFGIVNALFTMFAMIGAATAVAFQRMELFEAKQQGHEQRFFQLIALLSDAKQNAQSLGLNADKREYLHGAMAFRFALERIALEAEALPNAFRDTFPGFEEWLNVLETVVDYVHDTKDKDQRAFFAQVVRSQLTGNQRRYIKIVVQKRPKYQRLEEKLLTVLAKSRQPKPTETRNEPGVNDAT